MNIFRVTDLGRPTQLREGRVIGATFTGADSDSGWYRLLPDGVTASRTGANKLTLNNLRADVDGINFAGWYVFIVNDGYYQRRRIFSSDGDTITVKPDLDLTHQTDGTELGETDIRYILMPRFLNAPIVRFEQNGTGTMLIAYSTQLVMPGPTGYSREVATGETADPTLIEIGKLQPNTLLDMPTADLRDIFYQFTSASEDNKFNWGEYQIQ